MAVKVMSKIGQMRHGQNSLNRNRGRPAPAARGFRGIFMGVSATRTIYNRIIDSVPNTQSTPAPSVGKIGNMGMIFGRTRQVAPAPMTLAQRRQSALDIWKNKSFEEKSAFADRVSKGPLGSFLRQAWERSPMGKEFTAHRKRVDAETKERTLLASRTGASANYMAGSLAPRPILGSAGMLG